MTESVSGANLRRRRSWQQYLPWLGGLGLCLSLGLLVALRGVLERPFTRLMGRVVDLVQDHAQGIVIVAALLVGGMWLLIGARCYFERSDPG